MLMTSVSVIAQNAWGRFKVNCNIIRIKLKIGQQTKALSFPNLKHSVYISVSCASNMMIRFDIYMDNIFQLLRNLNSSA